MKINIFVEGKHDKEFLEQYLKFLGYLNINVVSCGGNNLNKNIISKIQEYKDNDEKILLIFDADDDFGLTLERLKKESQDLLSDEDIFLFPNNFQNGELETLLFNIAKEPQIHECFKKYKKCIENYILDYGKNIHKKSSRYAYFEALGVSLSDDKTEKTQREQKYIEIFDFSSRHLNFLKIFLEKHCKLNIS